MIRQIKNYIKSKDYEIDIYKDIVHVVNYVKISDLSNNKIILLLKDMKIIINGEYLIINKLDTSELLIKGNIKGIDFIEI